MREDASYRRVNSPIEGYLLTGPLCDRVRASARCLCGRSTNRPDTYRVIGPQVEHPCASVGPPRRVCPSDGLEPITGTRRVDPTQGGWRTVWADEGWRVGSAFAAYAKRSDMATAASVAISGTRAADTSHRLATRVEAAADEANPTLTMAGLRQIPRPLRDRRPVGSRPVECRPLPAGVFWVGNVLPTGRRRPRWPVAHVGHLWIYAVTERGGAGRSASVTGSPIRRSSFSA